MKDLSPVAKTIIEHQQMIVGPLAQDQALRIPGIIKSNGAIKLKGNNRKILIQLVGEYSKLFGKASIEVCRDAVREINPPISPDDLPDILK